MHERLAAALSARDLDSVMENYHEEFISTGGDTLETRRRTYAVVFSDWETIEAQIDLTNRWRGGDGDVCQVHHRYRLGDGEEEIDRWVLEFLVREGDHWKIRAESELENAISFDLEHVTTPGGITVRPLEDHLLLVLATSPHFRVGLIAPDGRTTFSLVESDVPPTSRVRDLVDFEQWARERMGMKIEERGPVDWHGLRGRRFVGKAGSPIHQMGFVHQNRFVSFIASYPDDLTMKQMDASFLRWLEALQPIPR